MSLAALLPTEKHPHGDRMVIRAHNAAVRETLDWIEATLLETRGWDLATRKRPRVKAPSMVAALFRHIASRNLDPQLHTHAVIANMTRDEEGRWKSVEPTLLHRNARLIGAYYRDRLARQLSTDQMRSLLRAADELDASRVVLVGDSSQLRAVEAGQPTVRLYDRDRAWCSLDPDNGDHLTAFSGLLCGGNRISTRTKTKARSMAGRTQSALRVAMPREPGLADEAP